MRNTALQVHELASMQDVRLPSGLKIDGPLDALHGDLSGNAVFGDRLSGRKNESHNFQIFGLEHHECLIDRDASAQGLHIDDLRRFCVRECHWGFYTA